MAKRASTGFNKTGVSKPDKSGQVTVRMSAHGEAVYKKMSPKEAARVTAPSATNGQIVQLENKLNKRFSEMSSAERSQALKMKSNISNKEHKSNLQKNATLGKPGVRVDSIPLPPGRNIAKSLENLVKKGGGETGAQARLDKANNLKYLRNKAGGVGPGLAAAKVVAGQEAYKKSIMGERKQFPEGDLVGKPKASIPGDLVESKKPTPPASSGWGTKGKTDAFSKKSEWQKEAEARKSSQQGWQGTKKEWTVDGSGKDVKVDDSRPRWDMKGPLNEAAKKSDAADDARIRSYNKPNKGDYSVGATHTKSQIAAQSGGGKGKGRGNWGHKGRPGKKGGSA